MKSALNGHRTGGWNEPIQARASSPQNPYVDARSLHGDEPGRFHGRETLIASLLARLKDSNFLAIVGPPGSGKSSLVRAGLLPRLQQGEAVPGSDSWQIHVVTPMARPLTSLAETVAGESRAAGELADRMGQDDQALTLYLGESATDRTLVVVDQFEQIFTYCSDPSERSAFVANLLTAAQRGNPVVIIVLQADYYSECAAFPDLRAALIRSQEFVGRPEDEELRRAITAPAEEWGERIEPALVERLIADVRDDPSALPLLQQGMYLLWDNRDRQPLTLQTYNEIGGIEHLVGAPADALYDSLTGTQQRVARSVLLRLVDTEHEGAETRSLVPLEVLTRNGENREALEVVDRLANRWLVTIHFSHGVQYVQLAHEALISRWPRMRIWLDENRELLRLRQELAGDAHHWMIAGGDPDLLYQEKRLAQLTRGECTLNLFLTPDEERFLEASRRAAEAQEVEREQQELELESLRRQLGDERSRSEQLRQENETLKQQLQAAQAAGYAEVDDPELNEIMASLAALRITTFSAAAFAEFLAAMTDAFTMLDIELLLRTEMDVLNPATVLVSGPNLPENIYHLLRWAEMKGRVKELLIAALRANSTNLQLRDCVKKIASAVTS